MTLFASWLYQGATITIHIQPFLSSRICILSVYFLVQRFHQKFPRLTGLVGEWRRFIYHDIFHSCFGYLFVKDILFAYKSQELFSAFNEIPNEWSGFFWSPFPRKRNCAQPRHEGEGLQNSLTSHGKPYLLWRAVMGGGWGEGKVGGEGVEGGELDLASKK